MASGRYPPRVHPYRDPAPAPRWRLTPSRAAVIAAGLAAFVALVWVVRAGWRVWVVE